MFNPFAVDSPPPDIPLPEVFTSQYSWTYSSACPFVSPSLNAKAEGLAAAVQADPDVIVLPSPDRVQYFDAPTGVEYVLVPPQKPPTDDDPTGMKAMMEFLGFKKEYVDAAGSSINSNLIRDGQPASNSTATGITSQRPATQTGNTAPGVPQTANRLPYPPLNPAIKPFYIP